eukprot:TRINITY_DN7082_c0_g1_i5.p1 TRINITY_DN7082_c0_g1~~TRINITY_DN7082_c0_g1_i5.p1  ORF type:complete len:322 (+),score=50.91 TRINITY_DN7082_c0_g1_i5:501-1466(+)
MRRARECCFTAYLRRSLSSRPYAKATTPVLSSTNSCCNFVIEKCRMYTGLLAQNDAKDIALRYIELGGSAQDKLATLKERIVESNARVYKKDYGLSTPIYPVIDVKVLMPVKPLRKDLPKEVFKQPAAFKPSPQPQSSMYDAKRLGATIAPATYYPPPKSPYNNPAPQSTGGKHIFYPSSYKAPGAVAAPPLTPQLPKNMYGKVPPISRPSVISPGVRNTWESQKEVSAGRPSITSPIPPPAPAVMAPSSASSSGVKNTPPTLRGRILDQANFGIRAFKHDVHSSETASRTRTRRRTNSMFPGFLRKSRSSLSSSSRNPTS